jgi:hypothetical protein
MMYSYFKLSRTSVRMMVFSKQRPLGMNVRQRKGRLAFSGKSAVDNAEACLDPRKKTVGMVKPHRRRKALNLLRFLDAAAKCMLNGSLG